MRAAKAVPGEFRSLAGACVHETASLPARLALGASMLYHGTSKLRGEGPAQTGQMMESLGLRPGRFWAVATGVAETFAGVAALAGIATRPAALAVLVTQGVAVAKVHAPKGYSITAGGMEYNLALMAIAAGMLVAGAGRLSSHGLIGRLLGDRRTRRPFFFGPPAASPAMRALRLLA